MLRVINVTPPLLLASEGDKKKKIPRYTCVRVRVRVRMCMRVRVRERGRKGRGGESVLLPCINLSMRLECNVGFPVESR